MAVYYHGTNIGDLTELKPFNKEDSNLNTACVYLSARRDVALFYIWDFDKDPIRRMMMKIEENAIVFQEMFSGALERFYKGTSGYIYTCVGDYEMSENHGVKTCAISKTPVPVSNVEFIPDVYEEILKLEKQGRFIYERYEDLPEWRHSIIRGIIMKSIKKDNLLNNQNHANSLLYKEKYTQYWREAEVLNNYNLL